ncbi:hypothetical protein BHM03_00062846, partial [Ensete ventricosum]
MNRRPTAATPLQSDDRAREVGRDYAAAVACTQRPYSGDATATARRSGARPQKRWLPRAQATVAGRGDDDVRRGC